LAEYLCKLAGLALNAEQLSWLKFCHNLAAIADRKFRPIRSELETTVDKYSPVYRVQKFYFGPTSAVFCDFSMLMREFVEKITVSYFETVPETGACDRRPNLVNRRSNMAFVCPGLPQFGHFLLCRNRQHS